VSPRVDITTPELTAVHASMQAALMKLASRQKAAQARAEKALDAAVTGVRREIKDTQSAEVHRLEHMLDNSAMLQRHASAVGLAAARATILNDISSLRNEVSFLSAYMVCCICNV